MKKTISIILITLIAISSLASCSLIRKATPVEEKYVSSAENNSSDNNTANNTSDTADTPDTADNSTPVRYTESEASALLKDSLASEYPDDDFTVIETGDMTAQSDGSEYYLFRVTLPAKTEGDEEKPAETTDYYVSVNGVIYTELSEDNATVNEAAATFATKHGEKDATTGLPYKVEYQGTVKNNGVYCYNFKVFLEDTSGAEAKLTYKTNYIVSLDGHSSGEQVMEQN